ncbi:hypothetical protein ACP70R_046288 [Stipagrostis hirtigluma subsp. patula]
MFAVAAEAPPPSPSLARPTLAAARALTYLCLASMWAGCAGLAAVPAAARARGADAPVVQALVVGAVRAVVFASLLAVVVFLFFVRAAMCDPDVLVRAISWLLPTNTNRVSVATMLRDPAILGAMTSLPLILLVFVGDQVVKAKGPQSVRIGTLITDVGVWSSMAVACFVILPNLALKLWRTKQGGDAALGSIV